MSKLEKFLKSLHEKYQPLNTGQLASYIPQLANANPDWFAISVVTTDGKVFTIGDTQANFTIQSISKVFLYGMALEDRGREALLEKV